MRLAAFFAFLVLLGVAAAAVTYPRQSGISYSAYRIILGPGDPEAGRLYYADGKERLEAVWHGILRIYIRRPDLGKAVIINPLKRTGKVVPIDDPRVDFNFWKLRNLPTEAQGQEIIDGEAVTRFVAIDRNNKPQAYWLTDDGIPLRFALTEGVETSRISLIDLWRGPQPAHLFEVPKDIEIIPDK